MNPPSTEPVLHRRDILVEDLRIHVVEAGPLEAPGILFLHGWPQCAAAFEPVLTDLAPRWRVAAIDLPGIGESLDPPPAGDKRTLARIVHGVIRSLALQNVTLVGHDAGGQIAYAYLRTYPQSVRRVVIMNVVVPGLDPWDDVIRNPAIWHFAFHAIPHLPELLVAEHRAEYFDYFFRAIAGSPDAIGSAAKQIYTSAYARPEALRTGFDWYRAFAQDVKDNTSGRDAPVETPLLYVRGESEHGIPIDRYLAGFRSAGVQNVEGRVIPRSGHFTADEQPSALAQALEEVFASQ